MPNKYDREVQKLIAQAERMAEVQVARAIRLLNEARIKVAAAVAESDWQLYYLPRLKAAIDQAMGEFAARYGLELSAAQKEFWTFGQTMVDETLKAAAVVTILPAIDTAALIAAQDFSRHLIESLGRDAAVKIYNEMAMGIMGLKSPYEVMQAVGRNLKDPGTFKTIAARAETITRQECRRILSKASQDRMEAAAKVVPGLKKKWMHGESRVPRISHLAAQDQVRDVDKPFDVGGEKLMYPLDPAGSPGNTINCSCYAVSYKKGWSKEEQVAA